MVVNSQQVGMVTWNTAFDIIALATVSNNSESNHAGQQRSPACF